MPKEICLLFFISFISIIYNNFITPYLLLYINKNLYDNIIIIYVILTQIDNYYIYIDLNKSIKTRDINGENLNLIVNQLSNISRKQEEFIYKKHIKYHTRMSKSCSDLKK